MALTLLTSPVLAAPPPKDVELAFTCDAENRGCPSLEEFRAAVAERLGYEPFTSVNAVRRARVQLLVESGRLRGRFVFEAPGEAPIRRDLVSEAGDCAELGRSLALALSVTIDPMSLTRAPGTPPPSEPVPEVREEDRPGQTTTDAGGGNSGSTGAEDRAANDPEQRGSEQRAVAAAQVGGKRADSQEFFLRAEADGLLHLQPRVGLGFNVGLGWRRPPVELAVSGLFVSPTDGQADGVGRFRTHAQGGRADLCSVFEWLGVCASSLVASYVGQGQGIEVERRSSAPYVGVGAGVRLRVPLTDRVALGGGILGWKTLTPLELEVDGDSVFSVGSFIVGGGPALDVRLW